MNDVENNPADRPVLEFGGRVDSRFVDALIIAFGLFGAVLAIGAIGRGIRKGDDIALLLLGVGIALFAGLFFRHIRRAHIILGSDRMVVRKLIRSHVIPYDEIAQIAMYTRYNRQFLYRPVSPHPEYMRSDTLLLRLRRGRYFQCGLPYNPSRQPAAEALASRTGLALERLEGISAWKHRKPRQTG